MAELDDRGVRRGTNELVLPEGEREDSSQPHKQAMGLINEARSVVFDLQVAVNRNSESAKAAEVHAEDWCRRAQEFDILHGSTQSAEAGAYCSACASPNKPEHVCIHNLQKQRDALWQLLDDIDTLDDGHDDEFRNRVRKVQKKRWEIYPVHELDATEAFKKKMVEAGEQGRVAAQAVRNHVEGKDQPVTRAEVERMISEALGETLR